MTRIILFISFIIFNSFSANAQTITEMQGLDFGEIAIRNSTDNVQVTINTNNSFSTNGNTYLVMDPQRGEYHIDGMPASTAYTITTPASFLVSGGASDFTVDNIVVAPVGGVSDGTGQADFQIGARMISNIGEFFPDGGHNTTFDVTLNF